MKKLLCLVLCMILTANVPVISYAASTASTVSLSDSRATKPKLRFPQKTLYLAVGKSMSLPARFTTTPATEHRVRYTSSKSSVVKVNNNAKITARAVGTSKVIAQSKGVSPARITVHVVPEPITCERLLVKNIPSTMIVGQQRQIKTIVVPKTATGIVPRYATERSSVASINPLGIIAAKSPGKCVITVKAHGAISVQRTITVLPSKVMGLSIDNPMENLNVDDTHQLSVSVTPASAVGTEITFRSSDSSVASVDKGGLVRACGVGTTLISASAGSFSDSFVLAVQQELSGARQIDLKGRVSFHYLSAHYSKDLSTGKYLLSVVLKINNMYEDKRHRVFGEIKNTVVNGNSVSGSCDFRVYGGSSATVILRVDLSAYKNIKRVHTISFDLSSSISGPEGSTALTTKRVTI